MVCHGSSNSMGHGFHGYLSQKGEVYDGDLNRLQLNWPTALFMKFEGIPPKFGIGERDTIGVSMLYRCWS